MSADNYIGIQKIGKYWYVWHGSASEEFHVITPKTFRTKSEKKAKERVGKELEDAYVVEYGVWNFPDVSEFDYLCQLINDVRNESWDLLERR